MPYEITNRLRGPSIIKVVDALARTTINLSQLSANTNTENIVSATITSVKWSLHPTTGQLSIDRQVPGNAVVPVMNVFQSGSWVHDEVSFANTATGNLNITVAAGGGTVVLTLSKYANYNVETQGL